MSIDRYDTSGKVEAQFELGSDGTVLKNKLGIRKTSEINEVELDLLVQLYDVIPNQVEVNQCITSSVIKEWHRQWLGNVYAWAGLYRSVNMGKCDFQFAAASQIDRLMQILDRDFLARFTPCAGMNNDELAEAIAVVHVELILIHPFREGNGRLSRLLANVMAMQAGKPELDFSFWDGNKEQYFSSIQAGLVDYEPMKKLVRRVLPGASTNAD